MEALDLIINRHEGKVTTDCTSQISKDEGAVIILWALMRSVCDVATTLTRTEFFRIKFKILP